MMNVIGGLPRSGSTLLCNVLNQNPEFHASSTSCLPAMVASLNSLWSQVPEIKGGLLHDADQIKHRMYMSQRAMCDAWYTHEPGKLVFDKSRGWNNIVMPFQKIFPGGKVIICLRDLRDMFASIEKQHRKNPLLDVFPADAGITQRAQGMFGPKGMFGTCLRGIKDIIDRRLDVYWLRYEDFSEHPGQTMQRIYAYLGIEECFEHDFDNVLNVAEDPDFLYLEKYPHQGDGRIEKRESEWRKFMSPDLAKGIMDGHKWYNTVFGYGGKRLKPIRSTAYVPTV